ncbi:thioredoxin [Clostridium senegalense]|uniref:thioredoxin n=1 Tax=Clostridium senegalense TaxID=1465809 RepID=UPI000289C02A|nr:thioredoxin [Clostridium senegalense]
MIELKEENFSSEIMNSEKPIVVDFWATWCGPCQRLAPVIKQLSHEMPDAVFAKVNVEDNSSLARQFKVMSIPTIKIIKNGEVVDTSIGYKDKEDLKAIIEKHI